MSNWFGTSDHPGKAQKLILVPRVAELNIKPRQRFLTGLLNKSLMKLLKDPVLLSWLLGTPHGLVVRIWCFHCHGPCSILGQGTEIPQATW